MSKGWIEEMSGGPTEVNKVTEVETPAPSDKLSTEDKLNLRTLEAEVYKEQINFQASQQKAQETVKALNEYIRTLAEKHEKDLTKEAIDLKSLEWVTRSKE